jgi:hypothetical protein
MDHGAQMTRPLWPLALALWLGANPAMTQPVAPGCGGRRVAPHRAGQDGAARAARAAAQRAMPAGMSPGARAALRAERPERRAARKTRLAARCGGADPRTPKG